MRIINRISGTNVVTSKGATKLPKVLKPSQLKAIDKVKNDKEKLNILLNG